MEKMEWKEEDDDDDEGWEDLATIPREVEKEKKIKRKRRNRKNRTLIGLKS